ncbi:MAG TPA: GAF domain-containing protein, partial [Acidimicrobiales bacterium]|nr:GAF domain-containing protein [Acidimicrobiales bacterium]
MDATVTEADGSFRAGVLRRLQAAADLGSVQEVVRTAARRLADADGATFVLRDGDKCFYADEDAMSPLWKGQRFPLTNCISGWAMMHAQTVVVSDITLDERIPIEAYRPTFVRSLAMVPIGGERPVAAIGVYWAQLHAATADELEALHALADAAGDAIARIGLVGAPVLPDLAGAGAAAVDPVDRPGQATRPNADRERIAR